MCEAVKKYAKKYAKEYAKDVAEDAKLEEKVNTIKEMFDDNMPLETIAKYVRLSVDEVKTIIESQLSIV